MRRLLPLIAALAVVLAGCDAMTASPAPSPTPSPEASPTPSPTFDPAALDVGLVLAPPEAGPSAAHGEAVREAAEALEGGDEPNVRRIRVVDPPTEELRGDALAFLAADGADVVCTVGPLGGDHLLALADRHPRTTFCLLDGELDDDADNAFGVGLPAVEGAFLAGAAAALAAEGGSLGVVTAAADPVPDAQADAFLAGVRHVRSAAAGDEDPAADDDADGGDAAATDDPPGSLDEGVDDGTEGDDDPAEVATVTVVAGAASAEVRAGFAAAAGQAYRDDGLAVLVAHGGPPAIVGLVEAARAAGGRVVGSGTDVAAVAGETAAEVTVVSVTKRFEVVLEAALRWAESPDDPRVPLTLGDAFDVVPGGTADADELAEEMRAILEDVAEGRITVPLPDDGP